jgi:hypothetical protein
MDYRTITEVVRRFSTMVAQPFRVPGMCPMMRQRVHCVETTVDEYGRLDVLINNAGVLLVGAEMDKIPGDKFDEHLPSRRPQRHRPATIDLQHSQDGTRNKEIVQLL